MTQGVLPATERRSIEVRKNTGGVEHQDASQAQAEIRALTRQHQLVGQLLMSPDTDTAFGEVLSAGMQIMRADRGTIHVWDEQSQRLELAAQCGFDPGALKQVHAAATSAGSPHMLAVGTRCRIVVENFAQYAPKGPLCPAAGFGAMQSTPLARRGLSVVGVLATYDAEPHALPERELKLLDLYTRQAADFIDHLQHRESASDANRHKDEFLAVLAHELRGPLAPICTGLDLLKTTENDPAVIDEVHQIMERRLKRLTVLIDDLFDIASITKGVFSLKIRRIDMKSVIESAVDEARSAVSDAGHVLTIDLPDDALYLDGDPHRLTQVLANVLDNAMKFTPRGGVIRLAAGRERDMVVVTIEDNGIGIAPGEIRKLFATFGQVSRSGSGLGIGLALVKSLVELHGGTVDAHSAGKGRGAAFTIRLPAGLDPAERRPKAADPSPAPSLRILVVDDNRPAADMLAMMLEGYGNELLIAYSGEQAIRLAETLRPDVIFLDIGMPVIDGYETARRIRRQPRGQEPVLVALTGWLPERDKQKARDAGFDHYVVKPSKASDLRGILSRAKRRATGSRADVVPASLAADRTPHG